MSKRFCFWAAFCMFALAVLLVFPIIGKCDVLEDIENESQQRTIEDYATTYKEVVPWTSWNKFWAGAAIVGSAADVASTEYQLGPEDSMCHEANPLFGEDPNLGVMILAKVAVLGLAYAFTEVWIDPEQRQATRNWVYAPIGIIYSGVAARNMSLDCRP